MTTPLRIAVVGPVAQGIPPVRSGSVESVTALLVDGLVARGHAVSLFAAGTSRTSAELHATFARGYHEDTDLWPWELCELMNLAAAVERAADFDVIHYQAEYAPSSLAFSRLSPTPVVVTVHHAPSPPEVALWSLYPEAPFIAVSRAQAERMAGLEVVGTIHHAVDTDALSAHPRPGEDLLFLGRFTEGKGVLEAIEVARASGRRLTLAAAENEYYREVVQPLVDGERVVYVGEVGAAEKVELLGRAAALLYPVQSPEPFGLVLAEAMACGTPVAALRQGAVAELVDEGVTGGCFDTLDALSAGLPGVLALDREGVRRRAVERFSPSRMVDEHLEVYARLVRRRVTSPPHHPGPRAEGDLAGRSLLVCVAHPDDESLACGGLIALCAERGASVTLLCLTRGEQGPGAGNGPLGDVRERELRAAAEALGVAEVVLKGYEDGMLPWVDAEVLEADIADVIRRVRPEVVVTFDEDGLYWHPDHIAVHERTTAAVTALGPEAPALRYVSLPAGAIAGVAEKAGGGAVLGVADVDAFGAMAPPASFAVEAGELAGRKVAALRCHRSQVEGGPLARIATADAVRLLATEHYRVAPVGAPGPAFIDGFGTPLRAAKV